MSLYPRDGANMGELLRHSDTAMYQAKDRGRNNFQLFSPAMDRRLKERMAIETSLRTALQTPSSSTCTTSRSSTSQSNRVVALESLLRWKHPTHGFIPPERFIAVAEETGLIVPIGEFVLARAFEDMARWRASRLRTGADRRQHLGSAAAALQPAGHDHEAHASNTASSPRMLQLELTESAVFERREGRTGESNEDAVATAARAGRAHRHRRLRHRLFEPVLPETLAGGLPEDRPQLRARPGDRYERPRDRRRHHRHGAASAHPGRRRGHRGLAAAREAAAARMRAGAGLSARQTRARGAVPALSRGIPLDLTEIDPLSDALEATGT